MYGVIDGTIVIVYYYYICHTLLTIHYSVFLFSYAWCLCMAINVIVQYNGGLLPDIILLTQGYYHRGTRLHTMQRPCLYSLCNSILLLPCWKLYYIGSVSFLLFVWCPCMAINVSVQFNSGLLPDIILLTQCYYHRGTCLNVIKMFCICSL